MRSVRVRLTLVATVVFGIVAVVASIALVVGVRRTLVDRIESSDREALEEVGAQLADGIAPGDVRVRRPQVAPPAISVFGPNGRPLPAFERLVGLSGVPPPGEQQIRTETTVDSPIGPLTLVAQRSLVDVDQTIDSVVRVLWVVVPVLLVLVGALSWLLAGRALRPVEAIRRRVEEISHATIDRRVPEPATDDEVARLARTMNDMLDRLEGAAIRQREFVSDASHELRSPVAVIRTTVEVALRDPERTDWPAIAAAVLGEDERMERVVGDLLALARAEEAGEPMPDVTVDLDDVVLEEAARARRVPVDRSRVSGGRVRGSREQLARVVRNLLDNAARHAVSAVAVEVRTDGDTTVLAVDDDGPGVPIEDRTRVFERFTRLDEGRARDAGGIGLGLATVRAVVRRHRGTVVVGDADLGGARFEVRLPAG